VTAANILLTGGAGFVGLNVALALAAAGSRVVLFGPDRPPQRAVQAFAPYGDRITSIFGDVRDSRAVRDVLRSASIEAIMHGAALTPGAANEAADAVATVEVNLSGTLKLVDAAAHQGVRRVLLLSSASVYGPQTGLTELDERTTRPDPATIYAITKLAAEQSARRLAAHHGLDLRIARLGSVFGPWERDTRVRATLSPIFQIMQQVFSGTGRSDVILPRTGRRDWIYAPDAAAAVVALLFHPTPYPDAVNIGLGHEWTVTDWCARLATVRPDFKWRLADPADQPTIDFHGPHDRPPLAIRRLTGDIGFMPRFGLEAAFDHYCAWLAQGDPAP
jgi:UDP-glucose 4-epimerase